jgi:hypothetical protein
MNKVFTVPMFLAFVAGVVLSASVKSLTAKAKAKL